MLKYMGIIVEANEKMMFNESGTDSDAVDQINEAEKLYRFKVEWMKDCLCGRMLEKQRSDILEPSGLDI